MGWGLAEWIKCVLYQHESPGLKPENPCKLRIVVCASVTPELLQGDGRQRQERGPASPVCAAASNRDLVSNEVEGQV